MAEENKKPENFDVLEKIYDDEPTEKSSKTPIKEYFSDPQKVNKYISAAILSLCLAALVLGFFQFRWGINKYFVPKEAEPVSLESRSGGENNDLLGLRQKDTDQDGLSDYDELYIYATSPYLADTDSDGILDKEEIANGTNPNCAEDQDCFVLWGINLDSGPIKNSDSADLFSGGGIQIQQLRELLTQSGFSEEEVNGFSDAEILEAYRQIILEAQIGISDQPRTIPLEISDISQLTPAQVRQLLRQAGIAEEILNNVSDEELMRLVEENITVTPGDSSL